jgi:hypothetical protein
MMISRILFILILNLSTIQIQIQRFNKMDDTILNDLSSYDKVFNQMVNAPDPYNGTDIS